MSLLARHGLAAAEIEAESLARLRTRLGARVPEDPVVLRMLYAAGDPDLAPAAEVHPGLHAAAVRALRRGAPLVCDGRMVAAGISRAAARLGCRVLTAVDRPAVVRASAATAVTRAALAMRSLAARLDGGVAVIGTSPTALLALLDLVDAGRCRPAAVVATPVGLVAAAEAKEELRARGGLVPYATVRGSRGGSPLAAAAVNALLAEAEAALAVEAEVALAAEAEAALAVEAQAAAGGAADRGGVGGRAGAEAGTAPGSDADPRSGTVPGAVPAAGRAGDRA